MKTKDELQKKIEEGIVTDLDFAAYLMAKIPEGNSKKDDVDDLKKFVWGVMKDMGFSKVSALYGYSEIALSWAKVNGEKGYANKGLVLKVTAAAKLVAYPKNRKPRISMARIFSPIKYSISALNSEIDAVMPVAKDLRYNQKGERVMKETIIQMHKLRVKLDKFFAESGIEPGQTHLPETTEQGPKITMEYKGYGDEYKPMTAEMKDEEAKWKAMSHEERMQYRRENKFKF